MTVLVHLISADIEAAQSRAMAPGANDFDRRTEVRTLFAAIEALVFMARASAIVFAEHHRDVVDDLTRLALREKTFSVNDAGVVKAKPAFLNTKTAMKLVARTFQAAEPHPAVKEFGVEWTEPEMQMLHDALQVRDRLMHPKAPSDLSVSSDESKCVRDAYRAVLGTAIVTGVHALYARSHLSGAG